MRYSMKERICLADAAQVILRNKAAECPMDGSPSDIPDEQLKELNIKLDIVKKG